MTSDEHPQSDPLAEAQERYLREREKRMRDDGLAQYKEFTGEYEDFVTGFVVDDAGVWGRPVGVAVAPDGALLFSDDSSGILWRVTPTAKTGAR